MARCLIRFSYNGSGFSGLCTQTNTEYPTIIGTIQDVIKSWLKQDDVNVRQSSRTDRGVHAFCNTAHLDIKHPMPGYVYHPDIITNTVNKAFMLLKAPIRILETVRVRDDFHCRFKATGRTYIYRIVHGIKGADWNSPFTPLEYQQALLLKEDIDIDKLHAAADILSGLHDFTSFTRQAQMERNPWRNPVKTMSVSVERGHAFMQQHLYQYTDCFQHYDLVFHGSSFLYKQVRKMTGAMLHAAKGRMSLAELQDMVTNPGYHHCEKYSNQIIPPYALYLKQVHYHPEDLLPPEPDGCIVDNTPILVELKKSHQWTAAKRRQSRLSRMNLHPQLLIMKLDKQPNEMHNGPTMEQEDASEESCSSSDADSPSETVTGTHSSDKQDL